MNNVFFFIFFLIASFFIMEFFLNLQQFLDILLQQLSTFCITVSLLELNSSSFGTWYIIFRNKIVLKSNFRA